MISIDASYILMPQSKKKSKSSVWSNPPTKMPWNQESEKACEFHLSRSDENKCQKPLVCHVLLLVNLPGSLPKAEAGESLLQTQRGSVRAIPQLCWNENVCASHSDFSKPANSTAQRLVTWKKWTMTENILFYIPMKKYSWEFSWPVLLSWSHRQIFLPRSSSDMETCTTLCKQIHLLSKPNILFLHRVFSIEEALKATQLTLKWPRLQVLIL